MADVLADFGAVNLCVLGRFQLLVALLRLSMEVSALDFCFLAAEEKCPRFRR